MRVIHQLSRVTHYCRRFTDADVPSGACLHIVHSDRMVSIVVSEGAGPPFDRARTGGNDSHAPGP